MANVGAVLVVRGPAKTSKARCIDREDKEGEPKSESAKKNSEMRNHEDILYEFNECKSRMSGRRVQQTTKKGGKSQELGK
jgi:uncharacterized protein with von Willebrand factor type A (vWA) domain